MAIYYETLGAINTVWLRWASGTSAVTTNGEPSTWDYWCSASTASTSNTVWVQWNVGQATRSSTVRWVQPRELTAKEVAERAEANRLRQEEWARQEAEREAQRKAAALVAEKLLLENLSQEQRQEYAHEKRFHVISQSGKRFQVKLGRAGNVMELNESGKGVNRFCIHPTEAVPDQDTMLAQKLLLETDEEKFRKIANRTAIAG